MSTALEALQDSLATADLRPVIFRYLDYRRWLEDFLQFKKRYEGVSGKEITLLAGFKSTSYLSMIIKGQRNLTRESLDSLARALHLNGTELNFLRALVDFSQAPQLEEKDAAYHRLLAILKSQKVRTSSEIEYEVFSNWLVVAVLEGLGTSWRKLSISQMADSLAVEEIQVRRTLESLEKLGLAEHQKNEWVRTETIIQTAEETRSAFIRRYHQEMGQKALRALDVVSADERFFSALTIPLTHKNFAKFKHMIANFQKEIQLEFGDGEKAEQVIQFNIQAFPLFQIESEATLMSNNDNQANQHTDAPGNPEARSKVAQNLELIRKKD